jgi:hypothetical protein
MCSLEVCAGKFRCVASKELIQKNQVDIGSVAPFEFAFLIDDVCDNASSVVDR